MQRRAAAIYFVFFLVIAAGAWAYIGVAEDTQRPQFSVSGPTFENGTTQEIGGTEYTVENIESAGGSGSAELAATLLWTNESALLTETIDNGSIIPYEGADHEVIIGNVSAESPVTLQQYYNVSAMLQNDDAVENDLATQNGTDYVVYRSNQSLRPLAEYLPERNVAELGVGDSLEYQGNETTVREVTSDGVTVGRFGPAQLEADLSEGGNVTLANDEQYFAHFPSSDSVTLVPSEQYPGYAETVAERDYFNERLAGLWGIVIVAGLAALLLMAMAYMPVRG